MLKIIHIDFIRQNSYNKDSEVFLEKVIIKYTSKAANQDSVSQQAYKR